MILRNLFERKIIQPPDWLILNTVYLTVMGSHAYGTANFSEGDLSDFDVYGICIPKKDILFPHLAGRIFGYDDDQRFNQWQQHHVFDKDALGGKGREYDFSVYNIVKYFVLLKECNPNIVSSIFTDTDCVLHITEVGHLIKDNRKLFIHKGLYHKFKGYSYSQLHKMCTKDPVGKRKEIRDKHGFDVKFAMNVVRLLLECEQLMVEGDLDLRKHREHLKSIRRGEIPEQEIREWASNKEKQLEQLYHESKLPWGPDEAKIKQLLLTCLESHYGSLDKAIVVPGKNDELLRQIRELANKADLGV